MRGRGPSGLQSRGRGAARELDLDLCFSLCELRCSVWGLPGGSGSSLRWGVGGGWQASVVPGWEAGFLGAVDSCAVAEGGGIQSVEWRTVGAFVGPAPRLVVGPPPPPWGPVPSLAQALSVEVPSSSGQADPVGGAVGLAGLGERSRKSRLINR